jgi:Mg2+-importing ATPase
MQDSRVSTTPWQDPLAVVLESLRTDGQGLTSAEVEERQRCYGPNQPHWQRSRRAVLLDAARRIFNPLVIVLLIASLLSAIVGERVQASIIALMVVASGAIDLFQTHRSQQAAERLRRRVEHQATVRRDGAWIDVPVREVVPGDRIRLSAGDIVPADARLLTATALEVDEAALTGESLPVEKRVSDVPEGPPAAGVDDAVFMGTIVRSGSGEAIVTRTGNATAYARIGARLAARPPETAFDRGLRAFGILIARTVAVLVVFVLVVNLIARRDPLESLLFSIALAVGLTPEFLPMILSVTQAEGALRMARSKVIVRQLAAIQNFGNIDVLCSDKTGTLTEGQMRVAQVVDVAGQPSERVRLFAYINADCQSGLRSPFDAALLSDPPTAAVRFRKAGEIPFDFERRRVSVAVDVEGGRLLITKGAPESLLDISQLVADDGRDVRLDAERRRTIGARIDDLGSQGFRLLAVATRPMPPDRVPNLEDECDLTFEGLIAFSDPPKQDVAQAVAALREDGIGLKILTGDAEAVTRHVCTALGLLTDGIVTGEQIEGLDEAGLGTVVERADVFARVSPEQKLRIIQALQQRGHVVGYLGDGINDAPSLHAADVGISVAEAVDVARDAAQVVLLEKDLRVLHQGVVEGRKIFGNVMKYIMMGTSSNFGNMLSMAGAVLFLPFLPLLPSQVLLNNVLYDIAQVSIPVDRVDPAMVRRPRRWDMRFIRDFMLVFGPISSLYDFLTFFVLRAVFHADEALFHTGWFVESLATQTLVIFVIRTAGNPLRSRPNPWLAGMVGLIVAIGALLPWTPLAEPLGFVAPPAGFIVFVAAAVTTYLLLVELVKRVFYRTHGIGTR